MSTTDGPSNRFNVKIFSFLSCEPHCAGVRISFTNRRATSFLAGSQIMLTSYLVKCPHHGCDFNGSLLPSQDTESWRSYSPTTKIAHFHCPDCSQEWEA